MRNSIFLFNFLKSFGQYKKKNSIVFSKKKFGLARVLFWAKKYSKKAKHPRICPSFGGNMPEAQTEKGLLGPP